VLTNLPTADLDDAGYERTGPQPATPTSRPYRETWTDLDGRDLATDLKQHSSFGAQTGIALPAVLAGYAPHRALRVSQPLDAARAHASDSAAAVTVSAMSITGTIFTSFQ
jgi:hypothetical protein